jgi:hypothetical protein
MAEKSAESDAKMADQELPSTSSSSVLHASTSNKPLNNVSDTHDKGKSESPSPSKPAHKNRKQQDTEAVSAVSNPGPTVLSKKHRIAKAMAAAQPEGDVEGESKVGESADVKQTGTDEKDHDKVDKRGGWDRKNRHSPEKNAGKARVSSEMDSESGGNDVCSVEGEMVHDRGAGRHDHKTEADVDTRTAGTHSAGESGIQVSHAHSHADTSSPTNRSKASSEAVPAAAVKDATERTHVVKTRMQGTGLLEDLCPVASDDEDAQGQGSSTAVAHLDNHAHSDMTNAHGSEDVQPEAGDGAMQAEGLHKSAPLQHGDTHMEADSEPEHSTTHGQNTTSEGESSHARSDDVGLKRAHQHVDASVADDDSAGRHDSEDHHSEGPPVKHTHAESSEHRGRTSDKNDVGGANSMQETAGENMDSDAGNTSSVFEKGVAFCRDLSSMDAESHSGTVIPASCHENNHAHEGIDSVAGDTCAHEEGAHAHADRDEGDQEQNMKAKANAQNLESGFHDSDINMVSSENADADTHASGGGHNGGDVCMHDVSGDVLAQSEILAGDPLTC